MGWLSGFLSPGGKPGVVYCVERMWEFFDFEISREERQTFWECLCDGAPPLKCSPSSG